MSDSFLIIVPRDARFVPSDANSAAASEALRRHAPRSDSVELVRHKKPQFFDCGSNFSSVRCPHCARELEQEWWQDEMDADYDGTGFRLQKIKAPCCSAELTLNSLVYDWECGFGVFAINVTNPNIERLPDEGLTEIAGLFGAACRAIYAHY